MVKLKYKGTANNREISAGDLKSHGDFEGFTKTTWSEGTGLEQDVPQDVATKLVELHGDEFEIVDESSRSSSEGEDSEGSSGTRGKRG